jgi:hypothetical protein
MAKLPRPVHGPRPIAALVPIVARKAFNHGAPGVSHLMNAWDGIVGPVLGEATSPRRLSQATLTIGCSGPMALELQHLSTELIGRVNQFLGTQAVSRLHFVQIVAPRGQPRARLKPNDVARKAASEAVARLPESPLRAALSALGTAVLTESASRLGQQPRTKA